MLKAAPSPNDDAPRPLASRTVPIQAAFKELGVGRTAGYEAVRRGDFPVSVIKVGRKLVVSRAALDALLGGDGA